MTRPATLEDGWWLAVLWIADTAGVVSFRDVAPAAGPPVDPPLARLGPAMSGALAGMILEEEGRLAIRLSPASPTVDPLRPWLAPLAVRAAFKWEPMRVATMRADQLADLVLDAFRRAIESLNRP